MIYWIKGFRSEQADDFIATSKLIKTTTKALKLEGHQVIILGDFNIDFNSTLKKHSYAGKIPGKMYGLIGNGYGRFNARTTHSLHLLSEKKK